MFKKLTFFLCFLILFSYSPYHHIIHSRDWSDKQLIASGHMGGSHHGSGSHGHHASSHHGSSHHTSSHRTSSRSFRSHSTSLHHGSMTSTHKMPYPKNISSSKPHPFSSSGNKNPTATNVHHPNPTLDSVKSIHHLNPFVDSGPFYNKLGNQNLSSTSTVTQTASNTNSGSPNTNDNSSNDNNDNTIIIVKKNQNSSDTSSTSNVTSTVTSSQVPGDNNPMTFFLNPGPNCNALQGQIEQAENDVEQAKNNIALYEKQVSDLQFFLNSTHPSENSAEGKYLRQQIMQAYANLNNANGIFADANSNLWNLFRVRDQNHCPPPPPPPSQ